MKRNANKVLESIRQSLAQHLPSGGRAVLFGSQARGDARPDSDWDILTYSTRRNSKLPITTL
jgi:predicted nucleotidyltransferase